MAPDIVYFFGHNLLWATLLSAVVRLSSMYSLGLPPVIFNFQFFVCHVFLDFFKVWTHYDVDRSGYIESNELEVLTDK